MKIILSLIIIICSSTVSFAAAKQESGINLSFANQYFQEAKAASDRDGGKLWGVTLYGPMLFVDEATRSVVTNEPDKSGFLHREGNLFVGKLPGEINVANTAVNWAGVKWTMVIWSSLSEERKERVRLMTHELFHRIQDSINLKSSDPSNSHLDSQNGRTWLRLEWLALERSLYESGESRRAAIADAIYFHRFRQSLFPQAMAEEAALETNEGLAEYTGLKLSATTNGETVALAGYALRQARFKQTFTRSFAYATGPAYAFLLDAHEQNWRKSVKAGDDLSAILQQAVKLKLPPNSETEARDRAKNYDGDEIIHAETKRENRRREQTAKYRALLVDGAVLVIPVADSFNYSFNPNNLVPLENLGTFYPTARVTDDWGVLEVSDGALMVRENNNIKRIQVSAPADSKAQPLQGKGWKLELKAGWTLAPGERSGDFVVRKIKQ
jgi:hypothetical protein